MESRLADKVCTPCRGDVPRLEDAEIRELMPQVPDWELVHEDGVAKLRRSYSFRNFRDALALTNRIGELAEAEGHHPTLVTEWGRVTVTWWTHKIRGLFGNDFIMAAKSDEAYRELGAG